MLFFVPFILLLSLLSTASAFPLPAMSSLFGPNDVIGRDSDPVNHGL